MRRDPIINTTDYNNFQDEQPFQNYCNIKKFNIIVIKEKKYY